MKFYRRLKTFKAISFDLDDTLYDNGPVIQRAEDWMFGHFATNYSELVPHQWSELKWQQLKLDPELAHDVSLWRIKALQALFVQKGYSAATALAEAQEVFNQFLSVRSDFEVPQESFDVLAELARFCPVVAITNGNLDADKVGLSDSFRFILKAGDGVKSKPFPDMFDIAAQRLDITTRDILHVGDHLKTDVFGAKFCGAQAVWLNDGKSHFSKCRSLPDIEIIRLADLLQLVSV